MADFLTITKDSGLMQSKLVMEGGGLLDNLTQNTAGLYHTDTHKHHSHMTQGRMLLDVFC